MINVYSWCRKRYVDNWCCTVYKWASQLSAEIHAALFNRCKLMGHNKFIVNSLVSNIFLDNRTFMQELRST